MTLGSDGTLITQRFHFIPGKHPYQHIISWHRLVQELNENGVYCVCIFDGKERNHAKAREVCFFIIFLMSRSHRSIARCNGDARRANLQSSEHP